MKKIPINYEKDSIVFSKPHCVFVTLKINGELRGCVGCFHPYDNSRLHKMVEKYAIAAAFQDKRFQPITMPELKQLSIEISILSHIFFFNKK